jgi:hypothetical protein
MAALLSGKPTPRKLTPEEVVAEKAAAREKLAQEDKKRAEQAAVDAHAQEVEDRKKFDHAQKLHNAFSKLRQAKDDLEKDSQSYIPLTNIKVGKDYQEEESKAQMGLQSAMAEAGLDNEEDAATLAGTLEAVIKRSGGLDWGRGSTPEASKDTNEAVFKLFRSRLPRKVEGAKDAPTVPDAIANSPEFKAQMDLTSAQLKMAYDAVKPVVENAPATYRDGIEKGDDGKFRIGDPEDFAKMEKALGVQRAKERAALAKLDIPQEIKDTVLKNIEAKREYERKLRFSDVATDVAANPEQLVPFAGTAAEIAHYVDLAQAAEDLSHGKELSPEQAAMLEDFVGRAHQDTTLGADVAKIVAGLPAFAGEIMATAGISKAAGAAVTSAGKKLLEKWIVKLGKEGAREWVEKGIKEQTVKGLALRGTLKVIERGTAHTVGAAAAFPIASALRVAEGTQERLLPKMALGIDSDGNAAAEMDPNSTDSRSGQTLGEALWNSTKDNFVELWSESTGGLWTHGSAGAKNFLARKAFVKAFAKANPGIPAGKLAALAEAAFVKSQIVKTPGLLDKIAKATKFHGAIGEMVEERVGEVARARIDVDGQDYHLPSMKQLSAEFISFAVPGVAGKIARPLTDAADRILLNYDIKRTTTAAMALAKLGATPGLTREEFIKGREEIFRELPEELGPHASLVALVVDREVRALTALAASSPAAAAEMEKTIRGKIDAILRGESPEQKAAKEAEEKKKAQDAADAAAGKVKIPAYQYGITEDHHGVPFPGQLGEINTETLEYNRGLVTLDRKLSPEEEAKMHLTFHADTEYVKPAAPAAPVAPKAAATPAAAPLAKGMEVNHEGTVKKVADTMVHPGNGRPLVSFAEEPSKYVFADGVTEVPAVAVGSVVTHAKVQKTVAEIVEGNGKKLISFTDAPESFFPAKEVSQIPPAPKKGAAGKAAAPAVAAPAAPAVAAPAAPVAAAPAATATPAAPAATATPAAPAATATPAAPKAKKAKAAPAKVSGESGVSAPVTEVVERASDAEIAAAAAESHAGVPATPERIALVARLHKTGQFKQFTDALAALKRAKVEAPKVEAPKVEAPKVEAPKVEAPKVEAPKVEAPKAKKAKAEAPKAEAPKAEAPKAEAPKAEAPKAKPAAPAAAADKPAAERVSAEEIAAEAKALAAKDPVTPARTALMARLKQTGQFKDLVAAVVELKRANSKAQAEAPKVEAPKVEAPKAEAPKAEAPKAEAPKAEAPKAEAPKAEAPKAEAPKAAKKPRKKGQPAPPVVKVDEEIAADAAAAPTPVVETPAAPVAVVEAPRPAIVPVVETTPPPAKPENPVHAKMLAFIDEVEERNNNLASPAVLKARAKKAKDLGYITQADHDEILRVQKSLGSKEDTSDAFDELLTTLNINARKLAEDPSHNLFEPIPGRGEAADAAAAEKGAPLVDTDMDSEVGERPSSQSEEEEEEEDPESDEPLAEAADVDVEEINSSQDEVEVAAEADRAPAVKSEMAAWANAMFFAYAGPGAIEAYLLSTGSTPASAKSRVSAIMREREKNGALPGRDDVTLKSFTGLWWKARQAARSGSGTNLGKYSYILDEVQTQIARNFAATGSPLLSDYAVVQGVEDAVKEQVSAFVAEKIEAFAKSPEALDGTTQEAGTDVEPRDVARAARILLHQTFGALYASPNKGSKRDAVKELEADTVFQARMADFAETLGREVSAKFPTVTLARAESYTNWAQFILRRAGNWHKHSNKGKFTQVGLEDGDSNTGTELSQAEFDAAETNLAPELTDASTPDSGGAKSAGVGPGVSPARAAAALDHRRMREEMLVEIGEMIRKFSGSPSVALDEVELETEATAADVERAAGILLYGQFQGLFWEKDIRVGQRSEAVKELVEEGSFQRNIRDFALDIMRQVADRYPELSPRMSMTPSDSRNEGPGMTTGEVTDAIKDELKKLPRVFARTNVVANEAELPLHLRDAVMSRNALGSVRGLFDPASGRIYLVASNIHTADEAMTTLLHEAVGEYGVDQVIGRENWSALRAKLLQSSVAPGVARTYFDKDITELDDATADEVAREVLAHLAERPQAEPKLARRVWDFVRSVLRKLGLVSTYSDTDVAYILRNARGQVAVQSDTGNEPAVVRGPALSKRGGDADTAFLNFLRNGVDDIKRVRKEYHPEGGAGAVMEAIARKTRGTQPLKSQLAAILAIRVKDLGITVNLDPVLSMDGVHGRVTISGGAFTIDLDPTLDEKQFHAAAIEEVIHAVFFHKLDAFTRGEYERLTPEDLETLQGYAALYEKALAEAPDSVQAIARAAVSEKVKFERFSDLAETDPSVAPWYHILNLHEFTAGTFTSPGFQLLLANIDARGTRTATKPGVPGLLRSLFDAFVRIMLGAKVKASSALHRSTTTVLELLDRDGAVTPRSVVDTGRDTELGSYRAKIRDLLKATTGKEARTAFVRTFQDRFIDLKLIQKRIALQRGIDHLPDTQDAHMAAENHHGRVGERLEHFTRGLVKELGEKMKKHGLDATICNAYFYARHAEERNIYVDTINPKANGKGSGMSTRAANRILQGFRNNGKLAALADVAVTFDAITSQSLTLMRRSGLISAELQRTLRGRYKNYASLQGFKDAKDGEWADDAEGVLPSLGEGFDIRGTEPRRAFGRKSKAGDVLQNTIEQAARVIIRAEKNRVSRAMANLIDNNPDPELWERATPEYVWSAPKKPGELARRVISPGWMKDSDVFAYKEDGETLFFRLKKPELARNWKNAGLAFGSPFWSFIGAGLAKFNNFKAMASTQYNPEFIFTNFFRDVGTAALNLSGDQLDAIRANVLRDISSMKPIAGAWEAIRKGTYTSLYAQSFREMEKHGGRIIFFGLSDARSSIEQAVGAATSGNLRRYVTKLHNFISDYNGIVENATRLAVFHNLRLAGASADRAAHAARNITVNFNRKGEAGPALNAMYLFFNANVQSTARIYEALKTRGWRGAAWLLFKLMSLGFSVAALARYVGGKDPDDGRDRYDKVPDHVRHTNLVFMLPEGIRAAFGGVPGISSFLSEDGSYLKLPMPYGYNWFVNIGGTMEKHLSGNMTGAHALTDIFMTATETWNPVGGAGNLLQQLTPTAGRWLTDLSQNRDFSGRPIVPDDAPFGYEKPPSSKYFGSVSSTTRAATDWLNEATGGNDVRAGWMSVSPGRVEYMLNFFLSSAGSFAGRALTLIPDANKKANDGEVFPVNSIPGVRRFFGAPTDQGTTQVYTRIRDESKRSFDEVELFVKSGKMDAATAAAKGHTVELAMGKIIRETEAQRKEIHMAMAALRAKPISGDADPEISPKIAQLRAQDVALQKEVIRKYLSVIHVMNRDTDTGEAQSFKDQLGKYLNYFDEKPEGHRTADLDAEGSLKKQILGFDF